MTPGWWRDPLTPYGRSVVARKLGLPEGAPEVVFHMVVRGFQEAKGLRVTGHVDEPTASAIGDAAEWGTPPEWWREGLTVDDVLVPASVVYRLQGRLGLRASPLIDATTAWHLVVEHGVVVR